MRNLLRCVALAGAVSALACTKGGSEGSTAAPATDAGGKPTATNGEADAGGGGSSPPLTDGAVPVHSGDGGAVVASDGGGVADASTHGPTSSDAGDAGEPEPSVDGSTGGGADTSCLAGGKAIDSNATGACDDPIVVDLHDADFGDVFAHVTQKETTNGLPQGIGKCAATTERDVVYRVELPKEGDLEVSVDADDDADPIILVQDAVDPTCSTATTSTCVDDYPSGTCEYVRVVVASSNFEDDVAQVVIAETVASGRALHVRFRIADPAGGS